MSNQELVKFYEHKNLGLCDLETFFKKLYLTWGSFFWNTLYKTSFLLILLIISTKCVLYLQKDHNNAKQNFMSVLRKELEKF